MKLTNLEHIGGSQLIPGVGRTYEMGKKQEGDAMDGRSSESLFHERLRGVPQWFGIILVAAGLGVAAWLLMVGWRHHADPIFWLAAVPGLGAAILVPLVLALWELDTTVYPDRLSIRLRPFTTREVLLSDVESCEPRTYSGLSEHGGWGWRIVPGGRAYTVPGSSGVQLTLRGGKWLLISSDDPAHLAKAIRSAGGPA
jgi:MFS family permease